MSDDGTKSKQEETLNNLKKYNKERNTKIVDVTEELVVEFYEQETTPGVDETEDLSVPYVCEHCGSIVYLGQIHGLGFCKEKFQYQE